MRALPRVGIPPVLWQRITGVGPDPLVISFFNGSGELTLCSVSGAYQPMDSDPSHSLPIETKTHIEIVNQSVKGLKKSRHK